MVPLSAFRRFTVHYTERPAFVPLGSLQIVHLHVYLERIPKRGLSTDSELVLATGYGEEVMSSSPQSPKFGSFPMLVAKVAVVCRPTGALLLDALCLWSVWNSVRIDAHGLPTDHQFCIAVVKSRG